MFGITYTNGLPYFRGYRLIPVYHPEKRVEVVEDVNGNEIAKYTSDSNIGWERGGRERFLVASVLEHTEGCLLINTDFVYIKSFSKKKFLLDKAESDMLISLSREIDDIQIGYYPEDGSQDHHIYGELRNAASPVEEYFEEKYDESFQFV